MYYCTNDFSRNYVENSWEENNMFSNSFLSLFSKKNQGFLGEGCKRHIHLDEMKTDQSIPKDSTVNGNLW